MANLFVPYYTTKAETGGTGLGLPIVQRIINEHGAWIYFHSAEDVGTTVYIHFPYDREITEEVPALSEALTSLTDLEPKPEIEERSDT